MTMIDTHSLTEFQILPRSDKAVDFDEIAAKVLKYKTTTTDPYKVNTAGQKLQWFCDLIPGRIRERLERLRVRPDDTYLTYEHWVIGPSYPVFSADTAFKAIPIT